MAEQIIVTGYFDDKSPGFVRASGGGTTKYLRADGTWSSIGSVPDLADGSVTLAMIESIGATTFLGNATGSSGPVTALSMTSARSMLGLPAVTWATVRKTADTLFTSTTPANVPIGASGSPYMAFPVEPSRTYSFRFVLVVSSAAANTGPAVSVTIPGAAVFAAAVAFYGTQNGIDTFNITASDEPYIAKNVAQADTNYLLTLEGVILPNETGTVILRARNEIGDSAITIRRGSHGVMWDWGI